jgi:hypothetical protein
MPLTPEHSVYDLAVVSNYTSTDSDLEANRYLRVTAGSMTLAPSTQIGGSVAIRNETGALLTILGPGVTLLGLTDIDDEETMIALLVEINTYSLTGGK